MSENGEFDRVLGFSCLVGADHDSCLRTLSRSRCTSVWVRERLRDRERERDLDPERVLELDLEREKDRDLDRGEYRCRLLSRLVGDSGTISDPEDLRRGRDRDSGPCVATSLKDFDSGFGAEAMRS